MTAFGPLVSTEWLAEHLGEVKVIDASWRMPGEPPARTDYEKRHIPGAVFFDIDAIADQSSNLPHMLPSAEQFELNVGALGVSDKDTVIVYDDKGAFSAPRVWWTFRAMGHEKIAALDGGLPKWIKEGRAVTDAAPSPPQAKYSASFQRGSVCSADEFRKHLHTDNTLILDARSSDRFHGQAPEPRKGLRSGAMPGAYNLPFDALLNADGTFLSREALRALLAERGAQEDKAHITTCGSGVTAAVLSLALELAGYSNHKLYDGSWVEWGDARNNEEEFPVIVSG